VGTLLHSCVEICATIELSLGEVSGVSHGMGVVDGVHVPKAVGAVFGGLASPFTPLV